MGEEILNKADWFEKGLELSRQEKFEEAIESFERASEIDPNDYSNSSLITFF